VRTRPLKRFCDVPAQYGLNVAASEYSNYGTRLIRTSDIQPDGTLVDSEQGVFVPDDIVETRHRLQEGDLLFSRSGTLGRCIRVTESLSEMTFAGFLVRFRPKSEVDPRFIEYCANSSFFQAAVDADAITSTISNFNAEKYGGVRLPDVEASAQRLIADYLDIETARIDAIITKKQRMIELLTEHRLAMISSAVFGEVELPGGHGTKWPKTRLDRVATVSARIGWKALTAAEYVNEGFTFLSTPNIKGDEIDFVNVNYITKFRFDESPELKLQVGDVLLVKDGNTLGISNIVKHLPRPATVNGSIAVIRPFDVDSRYLRYVLVSNDIQELIASLRSGMGVPHLFQWDINRIPLLLPDPSTQRTIADYLDTKTARIDALVAKNQRTIELLRESRQALVTAAVMGELEISGVAA